MKDRASYGTPYTIGEARLAAADVRDPYHRELMQWLVRGVAELAAIVTDATNNLEAKSDRAHRLHVAKLFRDRMTAVVDADSLERAIACARCDGDGEVSHGSCGVPDCEHADPCPVCGGTGKRPTDDDIAALRTACARLAGDAAVAEAELAAFRERDRDRPHPWDEPGGWRDVPNDPIRTVAERAIANRGRDGLPPCTRSDVEALARWAIGKTAPVPGTST
jgi:hypothetical protein